jgi:tripeptidyl-peptidase-1
MLPLLPSAFGVKSPACSEQVYMLTVFIDMYNITEGTSATQGNELGIFEGIGDVYAQEDLNLFFTTLAR